MFRSLVDLLFATRAYHTWLTKHGRLEAGPHMKKIAEYRSALRKARARARQSAYAGATEKTRLANQAKAALASLMLEGAVEDLQTLRSGLPEPPRRHRFRLEHAAALGILHQLYRDFRLPDVTISALLRVSGIATLTAFTIKRYRTTYYTPPAPAPPSLSGP